MIKNKLAVTAFIIILLHGLPLYSQDDLSSKIKAADLETETRDTFEVSLGAEFNPSLRARITGFCIKTKDIILQNPFLPALTWINFGSPSDYGFEAELKYDFGRRTYLTGNYNYVNTPVTDTPAVETRNWSTHRHIANLMANIRLNRNIYLFTNCHFEKSFPRQAGDDWDETSGYAIVDATLIARKLLRNYEELELWASVYNLFDKEYSSPQDTRLPHDLPMPGINFLLEMKIRF